MTSGEAEVIDLAPAEEQQLHTRNEETQLTRQLTSEISFANPLFSSSFPLVL